MTVQSNYSIAIAMLSDWLENFFQSWRTKTKRNRTLYARFFQRFKPKLQVIAWNSNWFNALLAPVLIGRKIALVLVFWHLLETPEF